MMFRPWKGAKWGKIGNSVGGIRLLVLGESHYSDDDPSKVGTWEPEATTKAVDELALQKPHRFFTGLTQVISGRKKWQLSQDELNDIWAAICFYNYVPVYLAASRERPTVEQYRQGAEPFCKVLDELEPQAILVCGFELWWWVLDGMGFRGRAWETPSYPIGSALAARMMHPSANAFSSSKWQPVLQALLEEVRSRADSDAAKRVDG